MNDRKKIRQILPAARWGVLALVFGATVINILDRLSVSVLAPVLRERLDLTNLEYAEVGTWFLLAYTFSQGASGWMHDRIGAKRGFAISVAVWSAAAMLHATARGFTSLCVFRVLLGLGEGGNWPGALKVITHWFPSRERALAIGVVNGGSSLGAIVAPPIIVWLQFQFGWQAAFLVTGALGFVWLAAWWAFYRTPHPPETKSSHSDDSSIEPPIAITTPSRGWLRLLGHRNTWAVIVSRFLVDPIWWLYILWLPEYLNKVHGLSLKEIGWMASIPFVAAAAGGITGGVLAGHLIDRGWTLYRARWTVILLGTILLPAGILAAHAGSAATALVWISVVVFGFQFWISNVQILPADLFPQSQVASVAGLGGVGAGIGSMGFTLATGWVVDHFSYTPILIAAGLLGPAGTLALFLLLDKKSLQKTAH
jgi:ACS family hexuronate transporter-like MFS transporter